MPFRATRTAFGSTTQQAIQRATSAHLCARPRALAQKSNLAAPTGRAGTPRPRIRPASTRSENQLGISKGSSSRRAVRQLSAYDFITLTPTTDPAPLQLPGSPSSASLDLAGEAFCRLSPRAVLRRVSCSGTEAGHTFSGDASGPVGRGPTAKGEA